MSPQRSDRGGTSRRRLLLVVGPYAIAGLVTVVLAVIYLSSSRFLPYHRDAIGTGWEDLAPGTQVILRALIHAVGAGWLGAGLALVALAVYPVRRGARWAEIVTPAVGIAVWGPNLWATLEVTTQTDAVAPWYGAVAVLALLAVAGLSSAVVDARDG